MRVRGTLRAVHPARLVFFAALALTACTPGQALVVQLSSNMAPGREVEVARVSLETADGTPVSAVDTPLGRFSSLGRPIRIADFPALARGGRHRVTVTLLLAGRPVQIRRVAREIAGTTVITVLMTRDCNDVVCPGAGDPTAVECLGGRCVPPECDEEHPDLCPRPACAASAECAASAVACAPSRCSASGACFAEADDTLCGAGRVCDVVLDCVPAGTDGGPVPADGGTPPIDADRGPIDADPGPLDAGVLPDAGGRECNPLAPFGTPVLVPFVSSGGVDATFRLSPDELRGVFWSGRGGDADIYAVSRSSRADLFTVLPLTGINVVALDVDPTLRESTADVVFASSRDGNLDLFEAMSVSETDFATPVPIAALNTTAADQQPYFVANRLYFASDRDGAYRIYVSLRTGPGIYTAPVRLDELVTPGSLSDEDPAVTADGLTIYWRADRPGGLGNGDVYRATRSSALDPFGPAVLVPEVSSTMIDGPSWISADDCRLYLSSDRAGSPQVYLATRPR